MDWITYDMFMHQIGGLSIVFKRCIKVNDDKSMPRFYWKSVLKNSDPRIIGMSWTVKYQNEEYRIAIVDI